MKESKYSIDFNSLDLGAISVGEHVVAREHACHSGDDDALTFRMIGKDSSVR